MVSLLELNGKALRFFYITFYQVSIQCSFHMNLPKCVFAIVTPDLMTLNSKHLHIKSLMLNLGTNICHLFSCLLM